MSAESVVGLLQRAVRKWPDQPALRLDDQRVSYAELDAMTARVAALLRERGVQPGDRVAMTLPNVTELPACYYGILRAGALVVPMNPLLKEREVAYCLRDAGARLLLAWHEALAAGRAGAEAAGIAHLEVEPRAFAETLAPLEPEPPVDSVGEDGAVILYTSGTTGSPKGAELTHANLRRNAEVVVELFGLADDDVIFGGLPLFHTFGQTCVLNAAIAAGALVRLSTRFDPGRALSIMEREGVTVFAGVPTMYSAMLADPASERFSSKQLRLCVSGGASLPLEVLTRVEAAFGCELLEGYGLSETSPVASFNRRGGRRKPGSIGLPIDGVQMRLMDEDGGNAAAGEIGEIAIRGHNVMKGYWNRLEATAETIDADGWLRTGDLARQDEEGYFFIVDRKKEMIIRGGYNVYPREIEEVLYEHPAIREAAVVGLPHRELGEEVGAAIALHEGAHVDSAEIVAFVRDGVAAYKYPRVVWVLPELPKGPTGKILKRAIEQPGTDTHDQEEHRDGSPLSSRPARRRRGSATAD